MNIKERREFLARVSIFGKCRRGDLKALAKSCREVTFQEGEVICKQGERGSALFIIAFGKADVLEEHKDGNVMRLAELYEHSVVGELSVIDGRTRTATVVAAQKTHCLVLSSWDLNATIKDHPIIALDILKIVIDRYRSLTEKIRELTILG